MRTPASKRLNGLTGAKSLIVSITLGLPALADVQTDVEATWERFQSVCGRVHADPQGNFDALPETYPEGSFATATSTDGSIVRATVVENGFFDTVEVSSVDDLQNVGCTTYRNTVAGDGSQISSAVEALLRSNGDLSVAGGQVAYHYVDPSAEDRLAEDDNNFQFYVKGALPGSDVVSMAQALSGYVSFAAWRRQ